MEYKGFTLDKFQEDSIIAIENKKSVVVSAPTGSGKTLTADYLIDFHKNDPVKIIYTAPIKALSNQKYKEFTEAFGEDHVGLMTGDIVINPTAKVVIMTTEIYRNMVVSHDLSVNDVVYVIFDEIHYINDRERGYVWEESIIYSPKHIRFLCLSATIPNAKEFSDWIETIKEHKVETIIATKRNVPLTHKFYDYELGITTLDKIKEAKSIPSYDRVIRRKGKRKIIFSKPNHIDLIKELGTQKTPLLFFCFSRRSTQKNAKELAKKKFFKSTIETTKIFQKYLKDAPVDVRQLSSTQLLLQTLPQGIAFHHAGLLPVLKNAVEDLFDRGLINVLYTTETFAVGINMPAKTVCFENLRKFDGLGFRYLTTKEYFQIAGRAGRRGIDTEGFVVSMIERQSFNYGIIKKLTYKDTDPIKSQFRLSVNTVLNLVDRHNEKEIEQILRLSFYSFQKHGEDLKTMPSKNILANYKGILRRLNKFEYVKDWKLTQKGHFGTRIYADEMTMTEAFGTEFIDSLNAYQIALILGCLVYEPRENHKFKEKFRNKDLKTLQKLLFSHPYLRREVKFENLNLLTTILFPLFEGKDFFDVLELTNLLEGDLIRVYTQILDRIGQIYQATDKQKVRSSLDEAKYRIEKVLEGIYLV